MSRLPGGVRLGWPSRRGAGAAPGGGGGCADPYDLAADARLANQWMAGTRLTSPPGGGPPAWHTYTPGVSGSGVCCCLASDTVKVVAGWSVNEVLDGSGNRTSSERVDLIVPTSPTPGFANFVAGFSPAAFDVEYGLRFRQYFTGGQDPFSLATTPDFEDSSQKISVGGPLNCAWNGFPGAGGGAVEYTFDKPMHGDGLWHPRSLNLPTPFDEPADGESSTGRIVSYEPEEIGCRRLAWDAVWEIGPAGAIVNRITARIEWTSTPVVTDPWETTAYLVPIAEPLSAGEPPVRPDLVRKITVPYDVARGRVRSGQLVTWAGATRVRPRYLVEWTALTQAERDALVAFLRGTINGMQYAFDVDVDGEVYAGVGRVPVRPVAPFRERTLGVRADGGTSGFAGVYTIAVETEEVFASE